MSDKSEYAISMLVPFSMSRIPSYVTHDMQVLGVAKLDDDAKQLILDFKLVTTQHQYDSQSVSEVVFREVKIPYENILSAELKTFWRPRKPSELTIQVDSYSVMKDLPTTKPGRIMLEIDRDDNKAGSYFASALRIRTTSNREKYR